MVLAVDESGFEQTLIKVFQQINVAVANIRIYFWDHPEVAKRIDLAYAELRRLLNLKPKLTLIVFNNRLVIDKKPLLSDTPHLSHFINLLTDKGIEYLFFQSGLSRQEFENLLIGLAKNEPIPMPKGKAIRCGKIKTDPEAIDTVAEYQVEDLVPLELDLSLKNHLGTVSEFYGNIKQAKTVSTPTLFELAQAVIGYVQSNRHPFRMLSSIRNYDEYTFTHAINVCILTVSLAESLGFHGSQLHEIGMASLLHDVGKLHVPDAILNKNGKPTANEWRILQNHPLWGAMQIQKMKGVPKIAVLGALEHHMLYNGGGYPQLQGYKPSIVSQMIAIADTYDALRSNRPYQESKSHAVAADILTEAKGTSFSPLMVDSFLRLPF